MSTTRYRWWGFACRMIRDYPTLKQELEDLRKQTTTAGDAGIGGGNGDKRTVERIALRQLPKDDQDAYEAVSKAIELTMLRKDGEERVELIRRMYWQKRKMTIKAVIVGLYISDRTAKRWHGTFVKLVGKCYGFEVGT